MEHPGGQKDGDLTSETEGCGEASKYQHFWTAFTSCEDSLRTQSAPVRQMTALRGSDLLPTWSSIQQRSGSEEGSQPSEDPLGHNNVQKKNE